MSKLMNCDGCGNLVDALDVEETKRRYRVVYLCQDCAELSEAVYEECDPRLSTD